MHRSQFTYSILLGGLLLTALLLWFAVANYRNAEPVAHSILRGISLSLGQAIEALAVRDPSLKTLVDFSSSDSAYFSILDQRGTIRFHRNPELIGSQIDDQRFQAVVAAPVITEERIRLGTGEVVFETQQQLHLPGETLVLRLALHTWQADQIIRRARTGVVVIVVLLAVAWGFGVWVLRLQQRDLRRREAMARHEQLARLGELGAVLAHEVRTPLAGIKGFAQLLRERAQEPKQQEYAGKIVAESERLEGLVTDLLTYTRQETLQEGSATVQEQVQEACDHLAEEAGRARVALQVTGDIGRPVACPADRLRQLLLNLFANAMQAMPEGGIIRVVLSDNGEQATILISDSGPGFAEESLKRAFDPFYTTRASGSGLGLAVCRKLAEGYGGVIVAANAPEGGAEITLQLPLIKELA
ncbi:MAG: ATP-binding protein [Trichlorobacter sp.]|uniref:two-component system sensor histidine kinase NtrB n=1 Tax=Trichlorobacter sp. TaxID=2911007 RepID=UPI00256D9C96|nr:ATP-binding protein [Trichlorobacter sp.]MDK9716287.1 ATP-binding protein [Trichlorobacter sp.]